MLDVAAGGMFMNKSAEEGQQLMEEMANNAYQWPSERNQARRVVVVHHVDPLTHLSAQIEALGRKFDAMQVMPMPCVFVVEIIPHEGQDTNQ